VTTTAEAGTVDLAQSNGTPKRRGRPPGSKNKPKDAAVTTPKKRGRPRKTTATKTTTRTRRTATAKPATPAVPEVRAVFPKREAHTILIEDSGLVVVNSNGDSYSVTAPVIVDRRTK